MNISQNCLDIIERWEGLRLDAYLDPVGIPTIGYGTIRYPNGQKVKLGDQITQAEAEAFLKFEVDDVVRDLNEILRDIAVNQNQFDAVVSLCYNIGLGGFRESTVLRKLREGDFPAASKAFDLWNKGTVDGVKVVLPGLVNRRKDERTLFEKTTKGGIAIDSSDSDQDRVNRLEAYREGDDNVVVGLSGEDVVEILVLKAPTKEDWISLLRQYKNVKTLEIAPSGKQIPAGARTTLVGSDEGIPTVLDAPKLDRGLLVNGVRDDQPGVTGSDVKELQRRLTDLGYYSRGIDGIFGKATDVAVRDFQAVVFGSSGADGKVGPKTWAKLWGSDKPEAQPQTVAKFSPHKNYLKLTKTDQKESSGCFRLKLEYFKDGQSSQSIMVVSGQPKRQKFRLGKDSISGSAEPLPEGKWKLHDLEWAGGKDVYDGKVWNNGLGPVKIRMDYIPVTGTRRSLIEIHLDWNKSTLPGTAGCIGVNSIADFKILVKWLRETDPRDLYVDWGLGSVKLP